MGSQLLFDNFMATLNPRAIFPLFLMLDVTQAAVEAVASSDGQQ